MIAGSLTYNTEMDTKGFQKGVNKITGTTRSAGTSIKNIIAGLGITKLISKGIDIITSSMGNAISRLDTLNNFPKVMSNLGISTDKAQASIKKMSDKLAGLPTTLDSAALSVQRLTSGNGDVEKSTEYFLALNNALLAGGASASIQESAMEQLSQAYAKGKPDAMEWRSMLTAMPAQLKQVADSLGYTSTAVGGDLYNAIQKGNLSMDEFMEAIVKLNSEGINGLNSFEEQARNSVDGIATAITVAKTQVVKGLTDILDAINKFVKEQNLGSVGEIIADIGKKAKQSLDLVADLINGKITFKEFTDTILEAFTNILNAINEKIPEIIQFGGNIINQLANSLIENLPKLIEAGYQIIPNIIIGLSQQQAQLMPKAVELLLVIVNGILDNIDLVVDAAVELIINFAEGVINSLPILIEKAPEIIEKLVVAILTNLPKLQAVGIKLIIALIKGIIQALPQLITMVPTIITSLWKGLIEGIPKMISVGTDIVKGIWQGILNSKDWILNKVKNLGKDILNSMKNALGIHSPSALFRDEVGRWIPEGVAVGIEKNKDSINKVLDGLGKDMTEKLNTAVNIETGKMNASANIKANSMFNNTIVLNASFDGKVEMDKKTTGQILAPEITKTIKVGGLV